LQWYFSGVFISNTSLFPHTVLGYEVLSTAAFVYGDTDYELEFDILEKYALTL